MREDKTEKFSPLGRSCGGLGRTSRRASKSKLSKTGLVARAVGQAARAVWVENFSPKIYIKFKLSICTIKAQSKQFHLKNMIYEHNKHEIQPQVDHNLFKFGIYNSNF